MEKKIRLRLILRVLRAVIDVIETELDRQIERERMENNARILEYGETHSYNSN